jgi:hypothetical protein
VSLPSVSVPSSRALELLDLEAGGDGRDLGFGLLGAELLLLAFDGRSGKSGRGGRSCRSLIGTGASGPGLVRLESDEPRPVGGGPRPPVKAGDRAKKGFSELVDGRPWPLVFWATF